MSVNASIVFENDCLMVSGQLNFSSVMLVWKQSLPLLTKQMVLRFDLSKVAAADSAGLALLLEWMKWAKREKKTITFQGVPQQLLSIATVAGVDKFLLINISH